MKQSKRIRYYMIGGVLGIVCIYLIFGSNSCWLPNCKLLERMEDTFQPTNIGNCYLECYTFGGEELENLYHNGDVDFSTKVIHDEQNFEVTYEIVAPNRNGKDVRITVDMDKDFAHILTIRWEDGKAENCGC